MKGLRFIVPALVTAVLTVLGVFSAIWLTGMVPAGPWARLIQAGIALFIVGALLLVIAWSAYFTFVIRQSLKQR